jgi:LysM repeat protein
MDEHKVPTTMNNQSPLIPQGSLLDQRNKGRARVKIAIFLVLAIHGIGLMALLMQGCKQQPDSSSANTNTTTNADAFTNSAPAFIEPTNSPSVADTLPATNVAPAPIVEPTPPVTAPAVSQPSDYIIVKGDTFSTIAKKFHVTIKSLQEANPAVEPTKLKIGLSVHIPASTGAVATTSTTAAATPDASGAAHLYSVKSGDSLIKIAGQFGVTSKALRSFNGLKTDKIVVGQKLKIPSKTTSTTTAATNVSGQ